VGGGCRIPHPLYQTAYTCASTALTLLLLTFRGRGNLPSSRSVVIRSRTACQKGFACFLPSIPLPLPHLPISLIHHVCLGDLWFLMFCYLYHCITPSHFPSTAPRCSPLVTPRLTLAPRRRSDEIDGVSIMYFAGCIVMPTCICSSNCSDLPFKWCDAPCSS
jgi:hypothetical protein